VGAARGRGDGGDAAQMGEGGLATQPLGVVTGGDQQLPGGVDPDPGQGDQGGGDRADQFLELGVKLGELGLELLPSAGQDPQGGFGGQRWQRRKLVSGWSVASAAWARGEPLRSASSSCAARADPRSPSRLSCPSGWRRPHAAAAGPPCRDAVPMGGCCPKRRDSNVTDFDRLTWDEAMRRGHEALIASEGLYDEINALEGRSNIDIEKHLRRSEVKATQAQVWLALARELGGRGDRYGHEGT
jgi:hypothetical protein